MKRLVIGFVIAYLVLGLVVAALTRPEQMWTCWEAAIPGEHPGGEMNYMVDPARENPAAKKCRKSVTVVDQAQWVAFATPIWPVIARNLVAKAIYS